MSDTAVFGFDGPHEVFVAESSRAMKGHVEAIDVENNEYEFFTAGGTVMKAMTEGNRVILQPTTEKRPVELRERLLTYLSQPVVESKPAGCRDRSPVGG